MDALIRGVPTLPPAAGAGAIADFPIGHRGGAHMSRLQHERCTGVVPPSPYPTFHDRLVPLARTAVGKRSLSRTMAGPNPAWLMNIITSE